MFYVNIMMKISIKYFEYTLVWSSKLKDTQKSNEVVGKNSAYNVVRVEWYLLILLIELQII